MIEVLKKTWRGEEPLWKAFWLWGVIGNAWWLYFPFLFSIISKKGSFFAIAGLLIYAPLSAILTWQCADNTESRIYPKLAVAIAFIWVLIAWAWSGFAILMGLVAWSATN